MDNARIVCVRAIVVVALVSAIALPAVAQVTTGTLVGQLRDTSSAILPGATVVVTHDGTGVSRQALTDANGEFVLSALPAGSYTVRVELSGFKVLQQKGVELSAGQTARHVFTLELGGLEETVTVAVQSALVETSASLQADRLA